MLHDDPSAGVDGQLVVPSPLLPAGMGPLVPPVQGIAGGGGIIETHLLIHTHKGSSRSQVYAKTGRVRDCMSR